VRDDEERIWEALFTPQPKVGEIYHQKKTLSQETYKDVETSINNKPISSGSGEIVEKIMPASDLIPLSDGHILKESKVEVEESSLLNIPRRSGRQRVSRFNVIDVVNNTFSSDEEKSTSDSESDESSDENDKNYFSNSKKRKYHSKQSHRKDNLSGAILSVIHYGVFLKHLM
jgi:hypothetical protein